MSYIIKNTYPFVSIKLTDQGRQRLALGQLTFSSWAIGDSEINYNREEIVDSNSTDPTLSGTSMILRPFDRQPDIKYFITPANATSQYQPLDSSNTNVIKAIVSNSATTRGFFSASTITLTGSPFTIYNQTLTTNSISGGTKINLTSSGVTSIGDFVLIKLANNLIGDASTSNTKSMPNLWYGVVGVTGGTIQVDRNLPNYSAQTGNSVIIIYKGGEVYNTIGSGNTTAYWDSGTLSFDAFSNVTCNDVKVWNMNNVWCEDLAGITGLTASTPTYEDYTRFGSYTYLGTKNPYLEYFCLTTADTVTSNCDGPGLSYLDDVTKSISIIHYTNNTISNLYGEFLSLDATSGTGLTITLPDLMYNKIGYSTGSGTTMGMSFISSGATQYIGTSGIQYVNLVDNPAVSSASTVNVVGRVFPQLKMVVIHDDELVAALSYKSNRNWTLPALAANVISPTGGTSTGVLPVNSTMYLTYTLENTASTGLTTSIPCQDYIKVTNTTSSAKDIAFRINATDKLPYMRKYEGASYDGYGFYANKFRLMYQIVQDQTIRPDPGAWKAYDYTSTAITSVANQTIDPKLLENQNSNTTGFVLDLIKDSGTTIFDITQSLNMAQTLYPNTLQFGDERFFYGNLDTNIGATIYKTIFDVRVNSGQFNATTNPTRSTDPSTNPPNIKITDVGIYDSTNTLVCIGKVSIPVALESNNTVMLELSLDF